MVSSYHDPRARRLTDQGSEIGNIAFRSTKQAQSDRRFERQQPNSRRVQTASNRLYDAPVVPRPDRSARLDDQKIRAFPIAVDQVLKYAQGTIYLRIFG
jgi:hypothetical protein